MTVVVRAESEPLPEELWAEGRRAEAFEELYRRWHPALVRLCRRNLGGHGDPEAIAQEAFVRAWASLDRFAAARPFWPWVSTIARRLCIDQRRRSGREQYSVYIDVTTGSVVGPPDECVETNEEHRSALLALQLLKPAEQRVITLRDIRGWSYDEIARFEGVTIESIRGSLKRARASLRKSYERVVAGAPAAAVARPWRAIRGLGQRIALHGTVLPAGDAVLGAVVAAMLLNGAATPHSSVVLATEPPPVVIPGADGPTDGHAASMRVSAMAEAEQNAPARTSAPTEAAVDGGSGAGLPLVPPDGADSPEDVSFGWVTSSPSYERDGTMFVSGTVASQCPYGPCAVLFRSTDRGASWQRLPAVGFTGGRVVLPPRFADDPQIFVSGAAALLVSEDGGGTFGAVAPVGGPAAISPTFGQDHRVLLGQAPGWEYRDDVEAMRPSGIVAPSTSLFTTPAFSPSFAEDRTVFVGGTSVDGRGRQATALFRCIASVCSSPALLPGSVGAPDLAVSSEGIVVAWRGSLLFRSVDQAASFTPVALPFDGTVQDVAFDRRGALLVGMRRLTGNGSTGGLFRSADGGRTWERLGDGTRLTRGVVAVTATTDGRILAAVSAAAGGGLLCSDDDGTTWRPRCG